MSEMSKNTVELVDRSADEVIIEHIRSMSPVTMPPAVVRRIEQAFVEEARRAHSARVALEVEVPSDVTDEIVALVEGEYVAPRVQRRQSA